MPRPTAGRFVTISRRYSVAACGRHWRRSRKASVLPHDHVSSACARFVLDNAMLDAPAATLTIVTAAFVGLGGALPARAQDASPWQREAHAATRLLAGASLKTGDVTALRAGIEIRLDDG